MHNATFSAELTGLPALIIMSVLFYIFVYLPIKLVFALLAKVKQKNDRLRSLQQKIVIAEYETPKGLTPAEIGFLHDSALRTAEIYGTIMYLEHQGLITLAENEQQIIESTKQDPGTLKAFERYILEYVSQHQGEAITSRLLRGAQIKGGLLLKKQLQEAGYLLTAKEQVTRSAARLGLIGLSLVVMTVALTRPSTAHGILTLIIFLIALSPVYFVMSIFLYFTVQKIAGEPWLLSPEIKSIWPDIEGYSQYIQLVELDNLQFETETMRGEIKNKALPYAIALGYNTGWQDRLKG